MAWMIIRLTRVMMTEVIPATGFRPIALALTAWRDGTNPRRRK